MLVFEFLQKNQQRLIKEKSLYSGDVNEVTGTMSEGIKSGCGNIAVFKHLSIYILVNLCYVNKLEIIKWTKKGRTKNLEEKFCTANSHQIIRK